MAQNQQGNLSNYQKPLPRNISFDGKQVQTVDFFEHERWRWLVNNAITDLQNPGTPVLGNNTVNPSIATVNISADQNGHDFTNTGATGEVDFNLPPAVPGSGPFNFFVDAAQTLRVNGTGGASIQNGATVGVANGNIADATAGDTVSVKCVATNRWVCFAVNGTWTVT